MTMEQKDTAPNNGTITINDAAQHYQNGSNNTALTLNYSEVEAQFVCILCNKSFYNAVALLNHKKLQHDNAGSGGADAILPVLDPDDYNINNACGFKFVPLKPEPARCDDMATHMFTEDTSYLVVRLSTGSDADVGKRKRLEGVVKRTQVKQKPAVDLRGPFTCTFPSALRPDFQCRQIFFNCCEYSMHFREEHTKRRKAALRCQVCEKRLDRDFYPTTPLAAHLQAANRLTFSCRICGQTFLDSAQYDEHNRIFHAKMKPHQCSLCFKRFTQQGGLQQHMRMHTGIRPFGCTFCPKAFTQKAGLDQHLRTHTKIKPFKCVICNKCFSQSVHLRQHMRTHTNIQPFECSVCGRRFKQTSHLNFHMRSHGSLGVPNDPVEKYPTPQNMPVQDNLLDFLNLSNLQPMGEGDNLYYVAELNPTPAPHPPMANY
ncbi:hypothetical protein JYU34_000725 [Plutella xylostella]|uniref:C2H2-type domain-containing protein n=1 Tax=Plutella xylostella TaxID=51655 RepID=A0ABQ7R8F9_PLUXY|nr:hypothetical protein JYU34_000725 [Plutella xylostella]